MVLDKKGHFVSGLKADQFVLKIDNKPRSIAFFEIVASGSLREATKPEADSTRALTNPAPATPPPSVNNGRTVIYFVDDLQSKEVLRIAPQFCEIVGVAFPERPCNSIEAEAKMSEVLKTLDQVGVPQIESLPEDTNQLQQMCLSALIPSLLSHSRPLAAILASASIMRLLTHGVNEYALVGLIFGANFAMKLGLLSPEKAQELGGVALHLCDRYPRSASRGLVYMMYGLTLHLLTHHPADCLSYVTASIKSDLEVFSYWNVAITARHSAELHAIGGMCQ